MISELDFLKKLREVLRHNQIASTMLENRIKELDASLENDGGKKK